MRAQAVAQEQENPLIPFGTIETLDGLFQPVIQVGIAHGGEFILEFGEHLRQFFVLGIHKTTGLILGDVRGANSPHGDGVLGPGVLDDRLGDLLGRRPRVARLRRRYRDHNQDVARPCRLDGLQLGLDLHGEVGIAFERLVDDGAAMSEAGFGQFQVHGFALNGRRLVEDRLAPLLGVLDGRITVGMRRSD